MQHQIRSLSIQSSIIIILAGLISACGGGSGAGVTPPPPPPTTINPVFSDIQTGVFEPNCAVSGCHTGAGSPQGLALDAASSFALLVGVASNEVPTLQRVQPGNPNDSYLIQKLEGTAASGQRMPLNAAALPQATIDVIRQWITDGAVDDRATSSTPIRVASLSPAPGSSSQTAATQILASFDREPDASTINANTFVLESSGGDGTFGDGNETAITAASIAVPGANTQSAVFDLTGTALAADTYQVRILGSGASFVMDLDANALDGEFSGAFPSGDGNAGGDFTAEFIVSAPVVLGPTLDSIQQFVFTPTCATAGCHSGATPAQGMNLEDGNSFAAIVGVSSNEVPALLRVAAGDPDNSYLIQKIEGTATVGSQMPLGGTPLDAAVIAEIRQWISDGAQQ